MGVFVPKTSPLLRFCPSSSPSPFAQIPFSQIPNSPESNSKPISGESKFEFEVFSGGEDRNKRD
ncbi:hypothetical protein CCACVL1_02269 [Corchorus capsularis]|uniref:Uncharacterized protein n=1 Tax=Corchorus capsularis TaxID=210143 RepID=A0A1R3K9R5_COCAP|nr:hypothetical protein CCACVL1_02269 [Corchorus capsularis]